MFRIATLTLLALLIALSARAQSGVNLYVGDCSAGTSTHVVTNACTKNTGSFALVVSVVLPHDLPQFIGTTVHLGVATAAASLPDWWKLDGCRAGALVGLADATISPSCTTIWDAQAPATVETYARRDAGTCPNQIALLSSATLASPIALAGDGATELGVTKIVITKDHSTDVGACAGCSTGGMIVLSQIELRQADGSVLVLSNPIMNNSVTYNTGYPPYYYPGGGCFETPTRNRTWGEVKALYR